MPENKSLQELLDQWEAAQAEGHPISAEELCRDRPELLEAAKVRIQAMQAMDRLLGSGKSSRSDTGGVRNNDTPEATVADESRKAGMEPVPGYHLVNRLGQGGFGEVWQAIGPGGFAVALKFVKLVGKAGTVEAHALDVIKDIRHPNLLSTFSAWQQNGSLIIAMELADCTLLDRLEEVRAQKLVGIPRSELLEYFTEAAKGIDFLNEPRHTRKGHEIAGIQHRDIKPQNLLLVGGSVKVADFGLARFLTHTVTGHTGSLTPAYAAPEFFDGKTHRHSDQYSLAVTYCLLRGGRLPFEGNAAQVMAGHLRRSPDLTMLPEAERPVVARALAKSPSKRWPSCSAFVNALRDCRTLEPQKKLFWRWGAVAGLLLLMGSLVVASILSLWPTEKMTVPPRSSPAQIRNSIGMDLVLIPSGKFLMGSPDSDDQARDDEKPQHEVEITKSFYLGKYEVSRGQFRRFVEDTGYQAQPEKDGQGGMGYDAASNFFQGWSAKYSWRDPGFEQSEEHPVVNVTWNDAVAFCDWLSKKEGKTYRLPTEAEWEYSCRANTRTRFYGGDSEDTLRGVANIADQSLKTRLDYSRIRNQELKRILTDWFARVGWDDGYPFTAPVGSFKPNSFGLHDMHGNVWEWCRDHYNGDYYKNSPKQDPQEPPAGSFRVLRGGSLGAAPGDCRAARRLRRLSRNRSHEYGFRVVLVAQEPAQAKETVGRKEELVAAEYSKKTPLAAQPKASEPIPSSTRRTLDEEGSVSRAARCHATRVNWRRSALQRQLAANPREEGRGNMIEHGTAAGERYWPKCFYGHLSLRVAG
jgi:sulfatase modifying factor 1